MDANNCLYIEDEFFARLNIICVDEFVGLKNRNQCSDCNCVTKFLDVDVEAIINEA